MKPYLEWMGVCLVMEYKPPQEARATEIYMRTHAHAHKQKHTNHQQSPALKQIKNENENIPGMDDCAFGDGKQTATRSSRR